MALLSVVPLSVPQCLVPFPVVFDKALVALVVPLPVVALPVVTLVVQLSVVPLPLSVVQLSVQPASLLLDSPMALGRSCVRAEQQEPHLGSCVRPDQQEEPSALCQNGRELQEAPMEDPSDAEQPYTNTLYDSHKTTDTLRQVEHTPASTRMLQQNGRELQQAQGRAL